MTNDTPTLSKKIRWLWLIFGALWLVAFVVGSYFYRSYEKNREQHFAQLDPIEKGRWLVSERGCRSCHIADGSFRAPALEGLYGSTVTLTDGSKITADDTYLRRAILQPEIEIVFGFPNSMPSYEGKLSEQEIDWILDFLKATN